MAFHPHPLRGLDIGTGTGVISLMLAQRYEGLNMTAIEIQPEVAGQAEHNTNVSVFSQRIQVVTLDFLQYETDDRYDLIVCNPPYFNAHLQGQKTDRNMALHNMSLPFEQLIEKAAGLLAPGGKFWCISPRHEAKQLQVIGVEKGLGMDTEIDVYNKPGKHFRTLTCFVAGLCETRRRELLTHHDDGQRTSEFSQLMTDFYLENTENYKRDRKLQ